jgi:hypothetical protein
MEIPGMIGKRQPFIAAGNTGYLVFLIQEMTDNSPAQMPRSSTYKYIFHITMFN